MKKSLSKIFEVLPQSKLDVRLLKNIKISDKEYHSDE